jgi:16S rRNA processing protein RimM
LSDLPQEESLLLIGRVVKTQGIKGEIRIQGPSGETSLISPGVVLYLKNKEGRLQPLTVTSLRYQKGIIILAFQEVRGLKEAENLVGSKVYIAKDILPSLPPDEFYWFQLFGLKVFTEKGTYLGIIRGIMPTGSNDVLVVRRDREEYLIPAIAEVVKQVDLKEKIMVICPMAGLLPKDDL